MSTYLRRGAIDCLDWMSYLLTSETCFKYLLESCKKNPDLKYSVTTKMFCLSLISKCPHLFTMDKYSPYVLKCILKCAIAIFKDTDLKEEIAGEIPYFDPVSGKVLGVDAAAFMSDAHGVMNNCLNLYCLFFGESSDQTQEGS